MRICMEMTISACVSPSIYRQEFRKMSVPSWIHCEPLGEGGGGATDAKNEVKRSHELIRHFLPRPLAPGCSTSRLNNAEDLLLLRTHLGGDPPPPLRFACDKCKVRVGSAPDSPDGLGDILMLSSSFEWQSCERLCPEAKAKWHQSSSSAATWRRHVLLMLNKQTALFLCVSVKFIAGTSVCQCSTHVRLMLV